MGDQVPITEFPVMIQRGNIISTSRVDGGRESTDENIFHVRNDAGLPFISRLIEGDTTESRIIIDSHPLVFHILRMRRFTHIFSTTIKAISVNVIDLFIRPQTHQNAVEIDNLFFIFNPVVSVCVSAPNSGSGVPSIAISCRRPLKVLYEFGISIVNYCCLALRQWDYNHALIVPNLVNFA